jgi:hypothetical protein
MVGMEVGVEVGCIPCVVAVLSQHAVSPDGRRIIGLFTCLEYLILTTEL